MGLGWTSETRALLPPMLQRRGALRVGTTSLASAYESSLAFRMQDAILQPASRAARELLEGPRGPAMRRFLDGSVAAFDGRSGAATLHSFSFPATVEQKVAVRIVDAAASAQLRHGAPATSEEAGKTARAMRYTFQNFDRPDTWLGMNTYGHVVFDRRMTAALHAHLGIVDDSALGARSVQRRREAFVSVVAHELEHSVSPRPGNTIHDAWLEEGTAQVMAIWPGHVPRLARGMGVAPVQSAWSGPYPNQSRSVRMLLRAAGIDTRRASERAAADVLLQGAPAAEVPTRLATAIARRIGGDTERLEAGIRALDGSSGATRSLLTGTAR